MYLKTAEATSHTHIFSDINEPPQPLTPYTLMLVLAYFHHYTPEKLPRGRFISPTHLRILAEWIGQPAPQLRSLRQHLRLAAHIAILHAAGFLSMSGCKILPKPTITPWLHTPLPTMIAPLQQAMACPTRWPETVSALGLHDTLKLDYMTYLQQSLARQSAAPTPEPDLAAWVVEDVPPDTWQLTLPGTLPLWLHFDLRQLGHWAPDQPLTCTPLTIAQAVQRGYSYETIQWLLQTATARPLSAEQQIQLNQWSQRAHTYHLRTVQLLSVPHPAHLERILRRKEWLSCTRGRDSSSKTPRNDK